MATLWAVSCGKRIKFIKIISTKGFDKGIINNWNGDLQYSITSLFYFEPRSVSEASDFF